MDTGLTPGGEPGRINKQVALLWTRRDLAKRRPAQFEDYCTPIQSVRQGIAVGVQVFDAGGVRLK